MKLHTLFLLIALGAGPFLYAQLPQVARGELRRLADFPSRYVPARHVDVWLPPGYSPKKAYPVVYMHDGQMLFDSATTWNRQEWNVDEVAGKLIAKERMRPCIVVGVWNAGKDRHVEYFPQKPFESLPAARQEALYGANRTSGASVFSGVVRSDAYLKFLVEELKPYIDSAFATRPDRKNTFIAGSSMGGLISMYAVCEYPEVFGGAGCISTHWPGIFTMEDNPIPDAFMAYLEANLPDPKTHKLYFDYGTATLDAMYPPLQARADEVIRARGYTPKNWVTLEFPGEDHSEAAWSRRLHLPLRFLVTK
jgi:enterochelin esterase-like enzyme